MAMITQEKGGKRQILLIIVLIVLAIIIAVYISSTRRPAPTPVPAEEAVAPEMVAPEAKEVAPKEVVRPEALSLERITKILENLRKLDLVLHGKIPIEVDPKEIGRANPFVPY